MRNKVRRPRVAPIRQSVTIPGALALEIRRIAQERQLTMSTVVALAEKGVRAEAEAKENLKATYRRFMDEQDPARKEEAGKNLVRAVFGKDAIADDSVF